MLLAFVSREDAAFRKVQLPSSVEIRIIKREKILILVIETLHGMCLALGEIPDVAEAEFGDLMAPVLVDGGDKHAAEEDLTPFCLIAC